ncbi:enoyl-CoA hydratase/isomerase family protein [Uliginosibacterium sp. sgz301328]|uniref:enoyl-CoA hydratase/isomerase family protein n=1 Tax=Uliginosibacterium sp. sgz301328 TaxID=3243764 RepID=UPI00359ED6C0
MSDEIIVTRHAAHVDILLNRPDKGNAIDMPMLRLLDDAARALEHDREIRAVVLRGAGERFFCTGGDIAAWGALTPCDMGREWIGYGIEVFNRIAALPQPVIALLNGHTLGGGLELAMAADLRVAVRRAKLGSPEVSLGMIAGWGGVRRLAELIGPARAAHVTLLGKAITAEQALDWGLVTALVDDAASLQAQCDAWVETLCGNGPIAMALVKHLLAGMRADAADQHGWAVAQAAASDDCREGVAAFLAKRPPVYRNR